VNAADWGAVIAGQVCLVLLVALVVTFVRMHAAAAELRDATRAFRADAARALGELEEAVRAADFELDRIDAIVSGAEAVTGRVEAASDLAYRTFTSPVVKALAVGTGTKRAVRRFTGRQAG
jgi:hypothetical protein